LNLATPEHQHLTHQSIPRNIAPHPERICRATSSPIFRRLLAGRAGRLNPTPSIPLIASDGSHSCPAFPKAHGCLPAASHMPSQAQTPLPPFNHASLAVAMPGPAFGRVRRFRLSESTSGGIPSPESIRVCPTETKLALPPPHTTPPPRPINRTSFLSAMTVSKKTIALYNIGAKPKILLVTSDVEMAYNPCANFDIFLL
jgi:hypothetical protein